MAPKKSVTSKNLIRHHGSSSSSSSSILDSVRFNDEKAKNNFFENFSNQAIHLEHQVILSDFPNTPLPNTFSPQGWASLCEIPKRHLGVFIQEFYSNMHAIVPKFTTIFWGTHIVVTPKFISNVLYVPRVDRPDYPSYRHLSSASRDEMASFFCEKAMVWGDTLNFSTTKFAKGPRILNIVIFVLTPWSHYNTITGPCSRFLLSLLEDLSIDFHSHMIVSIVDCYRDTAKHDKLIFCSAITCARLYSSLFSFLCHSCH